MPLLSPPPKKTNVRTRGCVGCFPGGCFFFAVGGLILLASSTFLAGGFRSADRPAPALALQGGRAAPGAVAVE